VTNQDTRKRLIINRHIARMTPEEIARRFTIAYSAPLAGKGANARDGTTVIAEGRKLASAR
jgi:hypothetical protein